jgi:leucyl-tRNA synthetase
VGRLFERIQDFEKRVVKRRGRLSSPDFDALLEALALLATQLEPLAPHIAEELAAALAEAAPQPSGV